MTPARRDSNHAAPTVAVLFVMPDSVYKSLPECDCYDEDRDALTFPGGMPVVAHPPCRLWGRLAHFSTAPESEAALAVWAVEQVQRYGGVLEHPTHSHLWAACGLPLPGRPRDEHDGFTLDVNQSWWGHPCEKRTWLYIVGHPGVPRFPMTLDLPSRVVAFDRRSGRHGRPHCTKRQRSATPPELARWLVDVAARCEVTP